MRRSCHYDRFDGLEGQRGWPSDPRKVSVCPTQADSGKTVTMLAERSPLVLFLSVHHPPSLGQAFLTSVPVIQTQRRNVEPKETQKRRELATANRVRARNPLRSPPLRPPHRFPSAVPSSPTSFERAHHGRDKPAGALRMVRLGNTPRS
jgi:hypothetical protein